MTENSKGGVTAWGTALDPEEEAKKVAELAASNKIDEPPPPKVEKKKQSWWSKLGTKAVGMFANTLIPGSGAIVESGANAMLGSDDPIDMSGTGSKGGSGGMKWYEGSSTPSAANEPADLGIDRALAGTDTQQHYAMDSSPMTQQDYDSKILPNFGEDSMAEKYGVKGLAKKWWQQK